LRDENQRLHGDGEHVVCIGLDHLSSLSQSLTTIALENAMSSTAAPTRKVVPAQLGFLAIYNPSLGTTDETIEDQIVYYSSAESRLRGSQRNASDTKAIRDSLREENNEQLRQIGLAQGMVEFGRSFSDGQSVDTVETEKSRIVLHELEAGWWILAVSQVLLKQRTSANEVSQST